MTRKEFLGVEEKAGCTRQDEALKRGGVRWSQEEDRDARRMHEVGLGNAEIARRLGRTKKAVELRLQRTCLLQTGH